MAGSVGRTTDNDDGPNIANVANGGVTVNINELESGGDQQPPDQQSDVAGKFLDSVRSALFF